MYDLDTDPAIKESTFWIQHETCFAWRPIVREVDLDSFGDFKKTFFGQKIPKILRLESEIEKSFLIRIFIL